jgi:hypothetical protein
MLMVAKQTFFYINKPNILKKSYIFRGEPGVETMATGISDCRTALEP